MATAVKPVHLKDESISAPSTPRRVLLSHRRQTTADFPNGDIPVAKEKPMPNYLKPTISSCHDTLCRYPKSQQQHAEDSIAAAGAGNKRRLISVKSMEKPALPSSLNESPIGKTSITDLSPKAALSPKIVPEKASKAPTVRKTLARAESLPKSMPKRRKASGTTSTISAIKPEQEEKVLFIDSGVQGHACRHGSQSPKSNTEGEHCTISEDNDTGNTRAPPGRVSKKVCRNGGAPKKLKFQGDGKEAVGEGLKFKQREKGLEVAREGKAEQENLVLKKHEVKGRDAPPAYNDVIEETAARLATRRSKVKALVGVFESVISLQETETQPSQPQEEAAVNVRRVDEPTQLKPAMKKVKIGKEGAEKGRPGRPKPKKVKIDGKERSRRGQRQPEEAESKGSRWGQQSQPQETKAKEESGREGSKGGQLGQ